MVKIADLPVRLHKRYRIRLRTVRRPTTWDGPFLDIAFSRGHLRLIYNEFVEFTWNELCDIGVATFGKRADTGIIADLIEASWIEVEAFTGGGNWEPVSHWRVEELRNAPPPSLYEDRKSEAKRLFFDENYRFSTIAQRFQVSSRTVSRWINGK